ncbi:hypothetical protein IWW34DRAFT_59608 [Fusarium oxysporum f. sp. albedinis]|nr:hypothetical protein IWW34DRAFT_59608 [Fusarium oxysporum f. sp. albedinis]
MFVHAHRQVLFRILSLAWKGPSASKRLFASATPRPLISSSSSYCFYSWLGMLSASTGKKRATIHQYAAQCPQAGSAIAEESA